MNPNGNNQNSNSQNNNLNNTGGPPVIDPNAINQELNGTDQMNQATLVDQTVQQPDPALQQAQQPQQQQPAMAAQSTHPSRPQVVKTEKKVVEKKVVQQVQQPVNNRQNNMPPTNTAVPPQGQVPEPKGTKVKRIFMFILFALLIAFVFFLPEVNDFIASIKSKEKTTKPEEIQTGTLSCTSSKTTKDLNVSITADFQFSKRQLKRLIQTTEYSGEAGKDEEKIKTLKDECLALREFSADIEGTKVTCNSGSITTKTSQYFYYEDIDAAKLEAAYSEAGGTYPEFELNQSIDDIQKRMENAKYKCQINK